MTSLEQFGIGLNCNPPPKEPGIKYIKLLEAGHEEAVKYAIAYRSHHQDEPVEIWVKDGDTRLVVREKVTAD